MPELPEVETVRRGLQSQVLKAKVAQIDVLYSKMITGNVDEFVKKLKGCRIEAIDRRGKYLLIRFSQGLTVISHLRMEGKYFVEKREKPVEKHTHIIFELTDGRQLRYNDVRKFGRMQLIKTGTEDMVPSIKKLGPEPTADKFDKQLFYTDLMKRKKAIKTALLDQTLVAGIGNIYADEILWLSKVNPQTPCNHLTKKETTLIREKTIEELAAAVEAGGTTIRSYIDAFQHSGSFQFNLHVYGKKGQPCERCQTPIEKIVVGQRGTHFCPNCQKVK
ncbi:DNA-formamidopyrimidine glycosylase [Ligilactobacillus sp. WILCCON 0076]|uniref:Formamidopyrimidine-DNA glycosylase n=1 Tax=Ligilactobacillus ubinensis TaxID=2876789 RepID=A0A9X2JL89_9LACO|nr:DNA-formamidopyrimidine glycosylase [Ligilactobacillus ubinensis]MCP0886738.1 DNA-formamidopyrimidine glycosylase [Ligilactobacillus ubinensis]